MILLRIVFVCVLITAIFAADIEASENRLATKYKSVVENSDGSYTLYNPRLIWGNREWDVHSNSSGKGVCALFKFDSYLTGSFRFGSRVSETVAILGEDGIPKDFLGRDQHMPVDRVICYNKDQMVWRDDKPHSYQTHENRDGSVTLFSPYIRRGNRPLLLPGGRVGTSVTLHFGKGSSAELCLLFGYDSYLEGSVIEDEDKTVDAVTLKPDTSYDVLHQGVHPVKEITCFDNESFQLRGTVGGEVFGYPKNLTDVDME